MVRIVGGTWARQRPTGIAGAKMAAGEAVAAFALITRTIRRILFGVRLGIELFERV